VKTPRVIGTAVLVGLALLTGCGSAAPAYDIHELADEMRPVVTEIVRFTTRQPIPDDFLVVERPCDGSFESQRGYVRYTEVQIRNGVHKREFNTYTVETLAGAVRESLDGLGWAVDASLELYTEGISQPEITTWTFVAVPEVGGAEITVIVDGVEGETLNLLLLAKTDCAPGGQS